jgi:hypothetical protein
VDSTEVPKVVRGSVVTHRRRGATGTGWPRWRLTATPDGRGLVELLAARRGRR